MLDQAFARGWDDLVGRWGGPMSFRLLIQPTVAILFALRAGIKDARRTNHHFCGRCSRIRICGRRGCDRPGADVGTVFIVALILDSIYQVVVHAGIFTLELVVTATFLALVPYVVSRGLVTRIARWVGVGKATDRSLAKDNETLT